MYVPVQAATIQLHTLWALPLSCFKPLINYHGRFVRPLLCAVAAGAGFPRGLRCAYVSVPLSPIARSSQLA